MELHFGGLCRIVEHYVLWEKLVYHSFLTDTLLTKSLVTISLLTNSLGELIAWKVLVWGLTIQSPRRASERERGGGGIGTA
jgi:hypothetical protein